jgi:hypothetical protein
MTIVPPFPQDAIADVMAGTSSTEDDPPAFGVQVEARALRGFAGLKARVCVSSARAVRALDRDGMLVVGICV